MYYGTLSTYLGSTYSKIVERALSPISWSFDSLPQVFWQFSRSGNLGMRAPAPLTQQLFYLGLENLLLLDELLILYKRRQQRAMCLFYSIPKYSLGEPNLAFM